MVNRFQNVEVLEICRESTTIAMVKFTFQQNSGNVQLVEKF